MKKVGQNYMKGTECQYEEPRIILEDNGIVFLETELRKNTKDAALTDPLSFRFIVFKPTNFQWARVIQKALSPDKVNTSSS